MTTDPAQVKNQQFFDAEDAFLRTFWDPRGKHHWGLFEPSGCELADACDALDRHMTELAGIDATAMVLDVGCGNGVSAIDLARAHGCQVVGIDLSPVRIENARRASAALAEDVRERLRFERASATELPFAPATFSHAWSQATLFRVPARGRALAEVARVLRPGGTFVLDDIFMPTPDVRPETREHVYGRWNVDSTYSFDGYRRAIEDAGLRLRSARELSPHLFETFRVLGERTARKATEPGPDQEKYASFTRAYGHVTAAIEHGELGWGLFVADKPAA